MKKIFALTAAIAMFACQIALADSVVITSDAPTGTSVSAAQIASGAPAGTVFEFFATTDGDILSIGNVTTTGTYNDATFGGDTGESAFASLPGFERLQVDSWITTPGAATSILGGDGALDGDGTESWVDLSDEGAQASFLFARLTIPVGQSEVFSGQVTIAGAAGPFTQPFSFNLDGVGIPEPTTLVLASLGLIGVFTSRRRKS